MFTVEDTRTIELAGRYYAPVALHRTGPNGKTLPPIRNLSITDPDSLARLLGDYRGRGYRCHLSLDVCG